MVCGLLEWPGVKPNAGRFAWGRADGVMAAGVETRSGPLKTGKTTNASRYVLKGYRAWADGKRGRALPGTAKMIGWSMPFEQARSIEQTALFTSSNCLPNREEHLIRPFQNHLICKQEETPAAFQLRAGVCNGHEALGSRGHGVKARNRA